MKLQYPVGATPLDPNEIQGLIPAINTQAELNELEKANIREALEWARTSRKLKHGKLLSISGLFLLHRRMFDKTWTWAGAQRQTEKNIGVAPHQISESLRRLCDDVAYWIKAETYSWDEVAARFHHRLVQIHPFPNGNGRHSRIATDLLLSFNEEKPFSWGRDDLVSNTSIRERYVRSLREADRGNYTPLFEFVRS